MSNGDNGKVVKLRQPTQTRAAGVGVDDPINPKSLLTMTEVEQNAFLQSLRDRRMRAVEALKSAAAARTHASTFMEAARLERKAEQVQRQLDKATKALDKLEEQLYGLRALTLQLTDMDISK